MAMLKSRDHDYKPQGATTRSLSSTFDSASESDAIEVHISFMPAATRRRLALRAPLLLRFGQQLKCIYAHIFAILLTICSTYITAAPSYIALEAHSFTIATLDDPAAAAAAGALGRVRPPSQGQASRN
ncbi:hypothetical protein BJ912DRAFT_1069377 [Pholiota molesta]|nr:hypothetical protein BJ912DRAFT_1069377 [Pholiota molesta]